VLRTRKAGPLMRGINLRYGRGSIPFDPGAGSYDVLGDTAERRSLADAEVGSLLDVPIDSPPLEEIVSPDESVLIVVSDATRQTAAGQVVNLIVRRLIANGTTPHELAIIFATGIHRRVTDEEKADILTPFISQRIKTFDHDPRDLMQIMRVGETSGGIPVELDRRLFDYDHIVLVGGISFHYFAGFTGGRKLICPGLASSRTISETHKLAFDCTTMSRRTGVDTGLLDGNAVHEAFVEASAFAKPAFAISTVVNDHGEAVELYCGDWLTSHRAACDAYAAGHTAIIRERREVVIVSCGGYPHDINMIQAHKALDAAARACTEGGTIVLLAECADGLGRADLMDWFAAGNSEAMALRLCERYQVNGQTAWSLRQKTERFRVCAVSRLSPETLQAMGIEKIDAPDVVNGKAARYIIPDGAKLNVKLTD
jgi:nickel-dependent lactate racemase